MLISTKSYFNYSCTHRQHKDDSHCKFVHGYDRSFHFKFACKQLTETNFVMHFGKLKEWKAFLDEMFDHTFLANQDDPLMSEWERLQDMGALKLVVLPNVGMEGTSQFLINKINDFLLKQENGRVCCFEVETREHEKNSAIVRQWPVWFKESDAV